MGHHAQGPLPLAGSTGTRARVGTVFTDVFKACVSQVVQGQGTARRDTAGTGSTETLGAFSPLSLQTCVRLKLHFCFNYFGSR